MGRVISTPVIALLALAAAVGFVAILFWLWRQRALQGSEGGRADFRPLIGFSDLDGMVSIALLLSNQSNEFIWAEEIAIFLTDLQAIDQVARPSLRETQTIRQMIQPGEMLSISLAETIYKAAGKPQRGYTCVLSSAARYRAGKEEFEAVLENYRIRMLGLTASSLHRERRRVPRLPAQEKSHDIHAVETESK